MKPGYVFVKKGNAYITKLTKKLAKEANKTVYIVFSGSSTTRGIQVPADIRAKAEEHEKLTREDSGHSRGLREARIRKEYRVCLDAMFSKIPSSDADKIVILCREVRNRRGTRALLFVADFFQSRRKTKNPCLYRNASVKRLRHTYNVLHLPTSMLENARIHICQG